MDVLIKGADLLKLQKGLSRRESFAMTAMQALIEKANKTEYCWGEIVVKGAVQLADLLIKELDKKKDLESNPTESHQESQEAENG